MVETRSSNSLAPYLITTWIMSVIFVFASVAYFLCPFSGERREFVLFYISGLSVASVLIAEILHVFNFTNRDQKTFRNIVNAGKIVASLIALASLTGLVVKQFSVGLALASLMIGTATVFFFPMKRKSAACFLVFLFLLWQIFAKLIWWKSFDDLLLDSPLRFIVFSVAIVISIWWLRAGHLMHKVPRFIEWAVFSVFLGLYFLCATRQVLDFHHWSFFLGPIQLIRQGHWLLWDIPCQYGFLNILLASILPFESPLTSLYVLNSAALFIAAFLGYRLLISFSQKSISTSIFAGLLIFLSAFLLPAQADLLAGPTAFPSVSAFRFIWCYVLIYIFVRSLQSGRENRSRKSSLYLATFAWTLALFWSFESAVYSSCLWIPFFAVTQWGAASETYSKSLIRAGLVLRDFFLAALLPLTFGVLIYIYYKINLGHGPDWYAFYEYALAYKSGFGGILINYNGSVWTLLFVLSLLTAVAAFAIKRKSISELAVATSIIGLIWGTASYFVSRSHDNNLCNLAPITVLALSAALILAKNFDKDESGLPVWRLTIQSVLVAIMVIGTTATLGNSRALPGLAKSLFRSRSVSKLHQQLPPLLDVQAQALTKAGFSPEDSVVYLETTLLPPWYDKKYFYNFWLPFAPTTQFKILSEERKEIYVRRFLDMHTAPIGWMVLNTYGDIDAQPDFSSSGILDYYQTPEYQKLLTLGNRVLHVLKFKKKDNTNQPLELTR
jgi:hypothetical protein